MDRLKKAVLKSLRFYGTNAMRYKKTGYPEDAHHNFGKYNAILTVLREK